MDRFESLADRRIREATERGEFDDLPGSGRPLPGQGRQDGPAWWIHSFLERERARSDAADRWDRLERSVGSIWTRPSEAAVRSRVADINERIDAINATLAESERRKPLDVDAVVTAWKQMHRARRPR